MFDGTDYDAAGAAYGEPWSDGDDGDSGDEMRREELECRLYSQLHYVEDDGAATSPGHEYHIDVVQLAPDDAGRTTPAARCTNPAAEGREDLEKRKESPRTPPPKKRKSKPSGEKSDRKKMKKKKKKKSKDVTKAEPDDVVSHTNSAADSSVIDLCDDDDDDVDSVSSEDILYSLASPRSAWDDIQLNVDERKCSIDWSDAEALEDLTLDDIHNSLEDCDWDVMPGTHLSRKKPRYYKLPNVHCKNCDRNGHLSKDCPQPKKGPACCYQCAREGHTARDCPDTICRNCQRPGHKAWKCGVARRSAAVRCVRCKTRGHVALDCPDVWRQYHLTNKGDKLVQGSFENVLRRKFCCNCARRGHFVHECTERTMDPPTAPVDAPFISAYDDDHLTDWAGPQTKWQQPCSVPGGSDGGGGGVGGRQQGDSFTLPRRRKRDARGQIRDDGGHPAIGTERPWPDSDFPHRSQPDFPRRSHPDFSRSQPDFPRRSHPEFSQSQPDFPRRSQPDIPRRSQPAAVQPAYQPMTAKETKAMKRATEMRRNNRNRLDKATDKATPRKKRRQEMKEKKRIAKLDDKKLINKTASVVSRKSGHKSCSKINVTSKKFSATGKPGKKSSSIANTAATATVKRRKGATINHDRSNGQYKSPRVATHQLGINIKTEKCGADIDWKKRNRWKREPV